MEEQAIRALVIEQCAIFIRTGRTLSHSMSEIEVRLGEIEKRLNELEADRPALSAMAYRAYLRSHNEAIADLRYVDEVLRNLTPKPPPEPA